MRVRALPPGSDLASIYAADRICFPADDPTTLHDCRWWVARVDGAFAGYAGAKVLLSEGAVYLCRAGVLPEYRGRKLQGRLIDARVRWARSLGGDVDTVITYTAAYNVKSSNALIGAGFRLYRPADPWFDDADVLYWRRPI